VFVDIGNLLLYLGATFLISGGGAFFGAYLKEKAKRVAPIPVPQASMYLPWPHSCVSDVSYICCDTGNQ